MVRTSVLLATHTLIKRFYCQIKSRLYVVNGGLWIWMFLLTFSFNFQLFIGKLPQLWAVRCWIIKMSINEGCWKISCQFIKPWNIMDKPLLCHVLMLHCYNYSLPIRFSVMFPNRFYRNMFLPNAHPAKNQFYWIKCTKR